MAHSAKTTCTRHELHRLPVEKDLGHKQGDEDGRILIDMVMRMRTDG